MFTLDHKSCEDCTSKRDVRPPCINIRMQPPPGVILVEQDTIGWTCPFKASWNEVLGYIEKIHEGQKTPPAGINQLAFDQLKAIKEKIHFYKQRDGHMPDPSYLNFLTGAKTNKNNNTSYVMPDGSKRLMVFLRRLPDNEWWEFWHEFQSSGFVTPVSQMTTEEKIGVAVDRGYNKVPEQFKKACWEMVNPMSAVIIIGVIVIIAATPAKAVAMVKNCIMGIGLTTQLFSYADDFAKFAVGAAYANNYDDLDKAATALAHLLGSIGRDLSLAVLMEFITALKKGSGKWREAAKKGEAAGAAEAKVGPLGLKFGRHVTEIEHFSATHLLEGEFKSFKQWSVEEVQVVREPSPIRATHLEDGVIAAGKDEQLKLKSLKDLPGKPLPEAARPVEGFVGTRPGDFKTGGPDFSQGRNFDMGHIHPKFKGLGIKKAYPLKPGTIIEDIPNRKHAFDFLYIDLAPELPLEKKSFLMVDRGMGTPVLPDIDMLATAPIENGKVGKPGASKMWSKWVPDKLRSKSISDEGAIESQRNRAMAVNTGGVGGHYEAAQHSGKGGAAAYVDASGKPKWNPVKDGKPPNERLIMFLKGHVYIFPDWYAFRDWTILNNCRSLCPWDF